MSTTINNSSIIRNFLKELLKLIAGLTIFSLGVLGLFYYDNCEQANAAALLGLGGLCYFFVIMIINLIKSIKKIYARSNNRSFSFKFILFLFALAIGACFLWGRVIIPTFVNLDDTRNITNLGNLSNQATILFYAVVSFALFCNACCFLLLLLAKLIKCIFFRSHQSRTVE